MAFHLPKFVAASVGGVWILVGVNAFVDKWIETVYLPARAHAEVATKAAPALLARPQQTAAPAPAPTPQVRPAEEAPTQVAAPEPAIEQPVEQAAAPATAPMPEAEPEPAVAAPAGSLADLLVKADPARGKTVAASCGTCHSFDQKGSDAGPGLGGVLGRDIGGAPGFDYSITLQSLEGTWIHAWLDQYLADPQTFAPGTKHDFAGMTAAEDRADVIAFLASISPGAPPMPRPALAPAE